MVTLLAFSRPEAGKIKHSVILGGTIKSYPAPGYQQCPLEEWLETWLNSWGKVTGLSHSLGVSGCPSLAPPSGGVSWPPQLTKGLTPPPARHRLKWSISTSSLAPLSFWNIKKEITETNNTNQNLLCSALHSHLCIESSTVLWGRHCCFSLYIGRGSEMGGHLASVTQLIGGALVPDSWVTPRLPHSYASKM